MEDNWELLKARVKTKTREILQNNKSGMTVMTIQILVNYKGDPVVWLSPKVQRVEPSSEAKDIIDKLFDV